MLKNKRKSTSTPTPGVDRASSRRWKFLTFKRGEAVPEQPGASSIALDTAQPAGSGTAQTCPKCSSQMVRRVAVYGAKAGNEFWGCSRFPACTGVRWS
ncbi:topoisomerase DNA-binding C4 zinc finger domain-containing protein [Novimethylophilus sp.]|uniref:topoisomerase DNA-binding C4 zinc finger domain-containing protein n=1 Tax=Novimethylophilus sp. TaxID=2137426 RepID=UPI0039C9EAC8